MSTETFRKGRFTVSTIPDDELPEGFLEASKLNQPLAISLRQSQQLPSECQSRSGDSPSGSSTQKTTDAIASIADQSVDSSDERCHIEPVIQVIAATDIQTSTSSDDLEVFRAVNMQVYNDTPVEQQITEVPEESGSVTKNADDSSLTKGCKLEMVCLDTVQAVVSDEEIETLDEVVASDTVNAAVSEEIETFDDPECLMDNRSERQATVCSGRWGRLFKRVAKKVRNSHYWFAFLCLLLLPTFSQIYMGIWYKNACTKPVDISQLAVSNGVLGIICLLCHIVTMAFKLFTSYRTVPIFSVISVVTIAMMAMLTFAEFIYFRDLDIGGSCWIVYYYMFYMNFAFIGVVLLVAILHLDLLYQYCCPKYDCISSGQTED